MNPAAQEREVARRRAAVSALQAELADMSLDPDPAVRLHAAIWCRQLAALGAFLDEQARQLAAYGRLH